MSRHPGIIAHFLLAASLGCGTETSTDSPFTSTDSAGVRIVESHLPLWEGEGLRIDPAPFLRVGQRHGDPAYQFGSVRHALLLSDGHIAVTDVQAKQIRLFDAEGRHVKTFGGDGEGPGEFRIVIRAYEYSDDSLAAFDHRLRRVTVFSRSTGGARTLRTPTEENFQVFGLSRGGPFYLYNPGQFRPELQPGRQWDSTGIVAMNASDGSSQVVSRLPVIERLIGPGGSRETLIPFGYAVQAVSAAGFYWATTDQYEVRFFNQRGRVRRILRRPVEPRPVNADLIAAYIDAQVEARREWAGEEAASQYRQVLGEAAHGAYVPLFGAAFVDGKGRLWISMSTWPHLDAPPRRWSVFSPDGIWLGDIEAPEGLRIVDSREGVVLGIWHDELDVPHVQLHRLLGD